MNLEWKKHEQQFNKEIQKTFDWLISEFNKIRTGRANPSLLQGVKVESFGTFSNLNEIANIQIPEARVLLIKPYDTTIINAIVKAINHHNDELNPIIDGKNIRITLPSPNEESRKRSTKLIKELIEKARVAVRNVRKEIQNNIKKAKLQEGLEKLLLENLEKVVKKTNEQLDTMFKNKEKELMTI